MLTRLKGLLKAGILCAGCVVVAGNAQAETVTMTPYATTTANNLWWQNIQSVSYTWNDANKDSRIDVGESVTFSAVMGKDYWGKHAFDAMKIWVDNDSSGKNLFTGEYAWTFDPTHDNMTDTSVRYQNPTTGKWVHDYSWKPWTDGTKTFSFSLTFATPGTYDLVAGVMCSDDLSKLAHTSSGSVNPASYAADWAEWTEDFHQVAGTTWPSPPQGETERFNLQVYVPAVPEPETYAMMIAGLGMMGAVMRRRRVKGQFGTDHHCL